MEGADEIQINVRNYYTQLEEIIEAISIYQKCFHNFLRKDVSREK